MNATLDNETDLDRFFAHYYARRPVNATFTGIHDYDGSLPDWSLDGVAGLTAEMKTLRGELRPRVPDPTDPHGLSVENEPVAIDCALADAFLEIQVAECEGSHFLRGNPALFTGEAVFSVVSLLLRDFTAASERVPALESRLNKIPEFLADARNTIDTRPIPLSWVTRALEECDGAISLFGAGLAIWCETSYLTEQETGALALASNRAQAAISEFRSWLLERAEAPARASGAGPDFYDLLLLRGHWIPRARSDLLAEARERFDEAEHTLGEMAVAADPDGWPAVSERLCDLHPDAHEYLDAFETTWVACRELALHRELVTWPDFPIRYVETPEWARDAAPLLYFLNYRSPAPFDTGGIHEYLAPALDRRASAGDQTRFLRNVNDSVIKLNHVVHHGAIGHHVQNYFAMRSESHIGQIAAVDCASRIGMFCGGSMAEGWACYATDLMGEVGFQTELELVAEQHSRLRQLARAITDIELHQQTWTEADARQFFEERVGMSPGAAAREVTRTSMFPGTAIMYWLGTQGIHDLRTTMKDIQGPEFSLRSFHDRFLSYGSIPVLLIARLMTEKPS